MDEREALAVLGLRAFPTNWVEVRQAFENKCRLARRRVQFPLAGMSRDDALDELDQVMAAWAVLQTRAPIPHPRFHGGHAPSSPPTNLFTDLLVLLHVLRVYLPKFAYQTWRAGILLWRFLKRSWQILKVTARWIVAVLRAYVRFISRLTGASPVKLVAATTVPLLALPLIFYIFSAVRMPETRTVVRHSISARALAAELPPPTAPTQPVEKSAPKCSVQFLIWPPGRVYCDEEYLLEAPSPQEVTISEGRHNVELISNQGHRKRLTLELKLGKTYVLKADLESDQVVFEETSQ